MIFTPAFWLLDRFK